MTTPSEAAIEQEILDKGLVAPRVTPELIDSLIKSEDYYVFPGTSSAGPTVTVVQVTLENGFRVVGKSACVSPENFDAELGRKIALGNARDKVWELEGYLLHQRLHDQKRP